MNNFQPGLSKGTQNGGNTLVNGQVYAATPVLNAGTVPTACNVMLAVVMRGRVVLGTGGYHAPRS